MKQTIFALASAQGRAGVAVIRLSGPKAGEVLQHLSGKVPKPRYATLSDLSHDGVLIDKALTLYFPAPNSFTGEDCAELQVHGSRAVLDRLYEVLHDFGLRLAEPGEFSRRAFENGKLDLTQAEAIADLVDAETEAQRQQALRQLGGALKGQYGDWRGRLTHILARIEVLIDFPDEDIPTDVADTVLAAIEAMKIDVSQALNDAKRGRQIREGFRIVILGKPNAGKSSLFNALLQTEAAIVTPIAGTTRDVLEAQIRVGNYQALIYDTAGLRETPDLVESEGIRRARARAETSDLRVWVVDAGEGIDPAEHQWQLGDFVVLNKWDMITGPEAEALKEKLEGYRVFETDLTSGMGLKDVREALHAEVEVALSLSVFPAATRERHFERLAAARDSLTSAQNIGFRVPEMMAEDIRQAIGAFDAIFGRQDVEQVLDHIFSSFCIGK